MRLLDRVLDWKINRKRLTFAQIEALDELEMRADHFETVEKAGIFNGRLFSLVFFGVDINERAEAESCCVVDDRGRINWMTYDDLQVMVVESLG